MAHPIYITFKFEEDLFICQCKWPHYICKVEHKPNQKIHSIQVAGYEIYCNFAGTLAGYYVPMDKAKVAEIPKVFEEMAIFYLIERIGKFPKRYEKYKIPSARSTGSTA
ncbi:MAG TPA: hypothetical protein VGZ90_13380 [Puia sp.]|jgi:hypothetical protein|nr:hypothetical protein [Puia sp.]